MEPRTEEPPPASPPRSQISPPLPIQRRVAVLLCDPNTESSGRGDENFLYAASAQVDALLMDAVRSLGHDAVAHYVTLDNIDAVVDALECDVVMNLCDGSGREKDGAVGIEALDALERSGLPYTGARLASYVTTSDKIRTKEVLRAGGVPVPAAQVFASADAPLDPALVGRRLIVKPSDSFGSAGIDFGSIVDTEEELRARVAALLPMYGPPLVEEYIQGREITVGVIGTGARAKALPPLEVVFGEAFPEDRRIRTHATKWEMESPLYSSFSLSCPARLPLALTRRCLKVARAAYLLCECTGYGRVDMRVDARGPFVLEVNANCSLEWGEHEGDYAMLPFAAHAAGFTYATLLQRLLDDALRAHAKSRVRPRAASTSRATSTATATSTAASSATVRAQPTRRAQPTQASRKRRR